MIEHTRTLEFGTHTALLHEEQGVGGLVRPAPADDIDDPFAEGGPMSMQEADWSRAVRELHRLGWQVAEEDDGTFVYLTEDGVLPEVVALVHESTSWHPAVGPVRL